jgi:uncharacterized repeat protein (TIGR04076 family)
MSSGLPRCKITVLKRTLNRDLVNEYLDDAYKDTGLCECFEDGQEFVIDPGEGVPESFCVWAWADIRGDIMTVAYGGDMPGMKQRGTLITGCRDWLRPVIFKVERMDSA